MRRTRTAVAVGAVLSLLLLESCATTTMTGSWVDPTYSGGGFKKIMIVGVAKRAVIRNIFESAFVTQLQKRGIEGVPSARFADGSELNKEMIAATLKELGCDGILITRMVDQKTRTTYYPPTGYVVPVAYRGGFYSYYSGAVAVVSSPGYVEESTTASLETNLYDVKTGGLVWTGLTDTEVYNDPEGQFNELISLLIKKIAADKLIQ